MRQRDIERHLIGVGGQRLQIGADLVAHITRRRRAVRADNAHIDLPVLHQMPARIVRDHRMRNAMRAEFIGCERCALIARARFVDPDMHGNTGIMRHIDGCQRRAPIDTGQPARIAMGENIDLILACFKHLADQRQPGLADCMAHSHILVANRRSPLPRRVKPFSRLKRSQNRPHIIQRPAQIDRCRARLEQMCVGCSEMGIRRVFPHREREAIGRCCTDEWRTPHDHGPYRLGSLAACADAQRRERMRKACLVDHTKGNTFFLGPDCAPGAAMNFHRTGSRSIVSAMSLISRIEVSV